MLFNQWRREILQKLALARDKSPKGSIDAPIVDLIDSVNQNPDYVTSSSCSGRIAIFMSTSRPENGSSSTSNLISKGGQWLLVEHNIVTLDQLKATLGNEIDNAECKMILFKHEPFILHAICRTIEAAKKLTQWGIACGFTESGITISNRNKIMCAIRSTSNTLEVPLTKSSNILVDESYLSWLVEVANDRFRRNEERVRQLKITFRQQFGQDVWCPSKSLPDFLSIRPMVDVSSSIRRVGHTLVYYRDHLIVFGGEGYTENNIVKRLSSIQLLKLSDIDKSQPIIIAQNTVNSDIVRARTYHSSSIDATSEQMIVFGGRAGPSRAYNDTLALDLTTFSWNQIGCSGDVVSSTTPAARWNHVACIAGSRLYIHGGRDSSTVFHDLWVLDLSAPKDKLAWRLVSSEAIYAAFDHVGVYVPTQKKLLFWGGLATLSGNEVSRGNANICYQFDLETEIWQERTIGNAQFGPQSIRFGGTISTLGNESDLILIIGGTSASLSRASLAKEPHFVLNTSELCWEPARIVCEYDSTTLVHSASTWAPHPYNTTYITGGGFQCFGFAHHYASSFCCELEPPNSIATTSVVQQLPKLSSGSLGVVTTRRRVKCIKTLLEKLHVYDKTRRVHEVARKEVSTEESTFLLPVTSDIHIALATYEELAHCVSSADISEDSNASRNKCGKSGGITRDERIRTIITRYAQSHGVSESEIFKSISEGFEYLGDVLLLTPTCCADEEVWGSFAQEMWASICEQVVPCLTRVARKARIDIGEMRQSHVTLLYVDQDRRRQHSMELEVNNVLSTTESHGWLEVRENGIVYGFDITKTMFSSGNVTEKARMAGISCKNEVIVDLFCGIGYYVLPFLVHGGASMVHACDWNPDAIIALRYNLRRNRVSDRCKVYEGDNQVSAREIGPISDRVNLGLLPKSEKAWPLAIQVLKPSGGWLHVHENVPKQELKAWIEHVKNSIRTLAEENGRSWIITCPHVEKVKSYAPRIFHYVADIHCVPLHTICKMPLPVLPAICVGTKPIVNNDRVRYYSIKYKVQANGILDPTIARNQSSFSKSERPSLHTLMLTICQNDVVVQHASAVTDSECGNDGIGVLEAWRFARYSFKERVCDAVLAAFDLQSLQHHPDVLVFDKKSSRTTITEKDRTRDDKYNQSNRTLFVCMALARNRIQLCSSVGDVYDVYFKFSIGRVFPFTLFRSSDNAETKPKRIDGLLIERDREPNLPHAFTQASKPVDARLYALYHPLQDPHPILCDSVLGQSCSSLDYTVGQVMDCISVSKGTIKFTLLISYDEKDSHIKVHKLTLGCKHRVPHSFRSQADDRIGIMSAQNEQYQLMAVPILHIPCERNDRSIAEMTTIHTIETAHGDNVFVLYLFDPASAQLCIQTFHVNQQHVSIKDASITLKCIKAVPISRNEAGSASQDLIVLSENGRLYLYHIATPICEISHEASISDIFPSFRNSFEAVTQSRNDASQQKQLQIMHPLDSEAHTGFSSLWILLWDVLEYCLPSAVVLCMKAGILEASSRKYEQNHFCGSNEIECWEFTTYLREMAKVAFQTSAISTGQNQVSTRSEFAKHNSAFKRMCKSDFHFDYQSQNPFLFSSELSNDQDNFSADQSDTNNENEPFCQAFSQQSFWNQSIVLLVFESLHLLHEDLRLRISQTSLSDRQSLSQILESLAVQLDLLDYEQYYQTTRPYSGTKIARRRYSRPQEKVHPFHSGSIGQIAENNNQSAHVTIPPDLLSWLHANQKEFASFQPYRFPILAKKLDRDRSRAHRKSPLWRSESLVWMFDTMRLTDSATEGLIEKESLLRILVFLSEDKIGAQLDLQELPFGITCPFLIAMSRMQDCPPPYLSEKICMFLDRNDLTLLPDLNFRNIIDTATYTQKDSGTSSSSEVRDDIKCEDDGLDLVMEQCQVLFPADRRLKEVRRLLRSSAPVNLKIEKSDDSSEEDFRVEQQSRLLSMCKRSMALSVARGMVTYGTYYPPSSASGDISKTLSRQDDTTIAWQLKVPDLPLAGRVPPRNTVVLLDVSSYAKELTYWPQYHNGCATGLRLPSDDKLGFINRYWIRFHRPRPEDYQTSTSTSSASRTSNYQNSNRNGYQHTPDINEAYASHAGFLLGLGLQGHLQCLSMADVYNYLSLSNEHLSVSILLGMAITAANTRRMRHLKNGERGQLAKRLEESQDISRLSEYDFDAEEYLLGQENHTHGEEESSLMTSDVNVANTTYGNDQSAGKNHLIVAGVGTGLELTFDRSVSKLLCLHIPALLPSSYGEFSTPLSTRIAALLGLGILYQGTGQRLMTETLLSEIKRSPCSPQFSASHLNNTGMTAACFEQLEGYSLAAGFALGLVLLGRGQTTTSDHGLMDLHVEENLYQCIVGGTLEAPTSDVDPQGSISGCLYRGRKSTPLQLNGLNAFGKKRFKSEQSSSGRKSAELINIDVTAPGSVFALAFMYMKTSNVSIAQKLALPNTLKLLECVRPDILMIRTIGKNLILWNDVEATENWILHHNVPQQLRAAYLQVTGAEHEPGSNNSKMIIEDAQLVTVAYANIIAGACMSIGLRYAGTSESTARSVLMRFTNHFQAMRHGSSDKIEVVFTDKGTIERCLVVCVQSLALVDAGTGNIESLRLFRSLNLRQHVNAGLTYGNHMALSMSIGLLFLGGGKTTISRSNAAIAALVIALYPIYPVNTADNKCHLQSFRHLYVLAADNDRFTQTISVDDCVSRSVSMSIQLRDMEETTIRALRKSKHDVWHEYQSPCILPELERIRTIKISSKEYYPIDIMIPRNFKKCLDPLALNKSHDMNQTRIQLIHTRRLIALKKRHRVTADFWKQGSTDTNTCISDMYTSWCHSAGDLMEKPARNMHLKASGVLPSAEHWWKEDGLSLLTDASVMCTGSKQLGVVCLQAAATLGQLHCALNITLDDLFNLKMFASKIKLLAKEGNRSTQNYAARLEIAVEIGLRSQWKHRLLPATRDFPDGANSVSLINYAQQVHPVAFYQLLIYLEGPSTINLWLRQWKQVLHCVNSPEGFKMENLDSIPDLSQALTFWQELLSFFSFIR